MLFIQNYNKIKKIKKKFPQEVYSYIICICIYSSDTTQGEQVKKKERKRTAQKHN